MLGLPRVTVLFLPSLVFPCPPSPHVEVSSAWRADTAVMFSWSSPVSALTRAFSLSLFTIILRVTSDRVSSNRAGNSGSDPRAASPQMGCDSCPSLRDSSGFSPGAMVMLPPRKEAAHGSRRAGGGGPFSGLSAIAAQPGSSSRPFKEITRKLAIWRESGDDAFGRETIKRPL